MKKIKWAAEAQRDLQAIHAYIARDSQPAANRFIAKLTRSTRRLTKFPLIGTKVEDFQAVEVREILCGNFRILYRFDGNVVEVIAVYHAARLLDDAVLPDEEE